MNKPYVKQFDQFGEVTNPIKKEYKSLYPNRQQRRTKIKVNEVDPRATRIQWEYDKQGGRKLINHYD